MTEACAKSQLVARTIVMMFEALVSRLSCHRKVDIRLHGKGSSKLPWRRACQPNHLADVVDSDQ